MENTPLLLNASDVARDRLDRYIAEKKAEYYSDETVWCFYTFLLKQAQKYSTDVFISKHSDYEEDRAVVDESRKERLAKLEKDFKELQESCTPPDNSRRGEIS